MSPFRSFLKNVSFLNAALLILLAVYLAYNLLPLVAIFLQFILKVLTPFLLAFVLYYLSRPIVDHLRKRTSIYVAIVIVYILLIVFLVLAVGTIYPIIASQEDLIKSTSNYLVKLNEKFASIFDYFHYQVKLPEELKTAISKSFTNLNTLLISSATYFLSTFTEFILSFGLALFILFYLLKDDKIIYQRIIDHVPEKYYQYVKTMLGDFDDALGIFIYGRVFIALITGALLFLAFLAIGLDYPVVLAIISFVFYIIPTLGSFLAAILPLIVGFSKSNFMGLEVLIVMTLASFVESFFLFPHIMGQLYIHPLTMVFILLVGGALFGMIGLLCATPAYVLLKIFVIETHAFLKKPDKSASKDIKA